MTACHEVSAPSRTTARGRPVCAETLRACPAALAVLCLAASLVVPSVAAHDLQYRVAEGPAVTVHLSYAGDVPFTFEAYEVYRAGDTVPVQVGRTDHRGRLAFLPDGAGEWRVRAFTEDGHGVDFTLTTTADAVVTRLDRPLYERYTRVFAGVGLLLGLFGLLSLFLRRRRARG